MNKATILNAIAPAISPIVGMALKQGFELILEEGMAKRPEDTELFMVSTYGGIDTKLEDLVKDTDTIWDDVAVKAIKGAFENIAKKYGVALPDLDDD